jgi:hypothetical protein
VLDAIALNDITLLGAVLALLVFGGLRFADDVVDALVSLDDEPSAPRPEDLESSNG